jgi:ABC-type multidrug transport system ATPase subunit
MTADFVLDARNLKVTFPSRHAPVQALNGVDLQIPAGSLFVLLGPNGAGKTTLMRCITGLVKPTAGSLSIFGSIIESTTQATQASKARGRLSHRSNLARMGVLIENPGLYNRMDARAYLTFFGDFYSIRDLQTRIEELCGDFGLILDGKPVGKLSQGNRQKLQLVRSLLHRPDFLLWDEPTDHLDPVSQKQILQYLRHYLSETGATALVATHRLEQMESVASHFGFLVQGKVLRAGKHEEILGGEGNGVDGTEAFKLGFARLLSKDELHGLAIAFEPEIEFKITAKNETEFISGLYSADISGRVVIKGQGLRQRMPLVIREIVNRNLPLVTVEPLKPNLSDVYERWVGN